MRQKSKASQIPDFSNLLGVHPSDHSSRKDRYCFRGGRHQVYAPPIYQPREKITRGTIIFPQHWHFTLSLLISCSRLLFSHLQYLSTFVKPKSGERRLPWRAAQLLRRKQEFILEVSFMGNFHVRRSHQAGFTSRKIFLQACWIFL